MNDVAEDMTRRASEVSLEIQDLLAGLGPRTQGAILADLVSLWLAGHIAVNEMSLPFDQRPHTDAHRKILLADFISLVWDLTPESEKEIMAKIEPQGRG